MSHHLDPDFADVLDQVFQAAADEGIGVEITSTYRSSAEQRKLYRAWLRRGKRGLPAARPGSSFHEYGLAVDISTSPPDALQRVGEIAEDAGLRYGGNLDPPDPVHIDAGSYVSLDQARRAFKPARMVEVA